MKKKRSKAWYTKRSKRSKHNIILFASIVLIFSVLVVNISSTISERKRVVTNSKLIREGFSCDNSSNSIIKKQLRSLMIEQLGKPYKYGSAGPEKFDCSGLAFYLYSKIGINLPRVVCDQAKIGTPIKKEALRFGDIIFFSANGDSLTHEGIYVGNGYFIHAPKTGDVVKISSLSSNYYRNVYKMSTRVVPD
jgi:hypothetical protein